MGTMMVVTMTTIDHDRRDLSARRHGSDDDEGRDRDGDDHDHDRR